MVLGYLAKVGRWEMRAVVVVSAEACCTFLLAKEVRIDRSHAGSRCCVGASLNAGMLQAMSVAKIRTGCCV